jgi:type VI secretion system protein ImpF
MPSILDRLIDPDSEGTAFRQGYSLEQIIDAVRRDLEDLLNSHQSYLHFPEDYAELRNSVLLYGMPDLMSANPSEREHLAELVEQVITRFEPRLRNIRVVLAEGDGEDRTVRLQVEAQVNVDPSPEVAFETVLELSTGYLSIQASEPRS